MKVLIVFGTRPEAIKMAPLVNEFKNFRQNIQPIVCVTGQHRQMLHKVLQLFNILPDYDLAIMRERQTLPGITNAILSAITPVLEKEQPDIVLVHGDTTTSFASALAAFYLQIPVGHVEAGLRTYDMSSPFPEEFNRRAVDSISSLHFAPTQLSNENLLGEGVKASGIVVTGNTAIDALKTTIVEDYRHEYLDWAEGHRLLLLIAHRRENLGSPMVRMFRAVRRILDRYSDLKVIYPIHMNSLVRRVANDELAGEDRIKIVEPLGVLDFHNFMASSDIILTDSDGVQEEAPSLGKPVLVMRDTTERPEGVSAGTLRLVGTAEEDIYREVVRLLDDEVEYSKMARKSNPYGDGEASRRIAEALESWWSPR